MQPIQSLLDWFAGNGAYMTLEHCMAHDTFWIWATVVLDFTVAAGYCLIALHWWKNQKLLPPTPAKRALGSMRNIFIFCGICGYVFIPIKMVWPAWRLYDLFMLALAYYTWRYAWNAKDLRVVYRELGRTNRLAAELEASREESNRKSFFLSAVSHDLRTPLNGIVLQADLAMENAEAGDRAGAREALAQIKQSASAAADLLDTLLEFGRLQAGVDRPELANFGLGDVVKAVVRHHEPKATDKGLYLTASLPAGLHVRSDRQRVERILNNLVDNALKFTDTGGVRVEVQAAREGVEIHVIDTGIGIAPEDHERLFEEFVQSRNVERDRHNGFGLGLAVAQRLARSLGGDIAVESALGAGSRFSVVLPATPVSTEPFSAGPASESDGVAVAR